MPFPLRFIILSVALVLSPLLRAEDLPAPPFDEAAFKRSAELQETKLLADGKLISLGKLFQEKVSTDDIVFAPPLTTKLEPPDLRDKLLRSTLVVGLYYKCHDCNNMHFETGGGFAVAPGGIISTCAHMMTLQPKRMLEAYPVAIDSTGKVYPIDRILAFDEAADTCLVHVQGGDFPPLSLRSSARSGENIYCLSHPGENLFLFTSGLISRIAQVPEKNRMVRTLDVSCEYSPGSSGCPIADAYGNVVGQVDKIMPQMLFENNDKQTGNAATVYNLRQACDVNEIIKLGTSANRLALVPMPTPVPKGNNKDLEEPADATQTTDKKQVDLKPAGEEDFVVESHYDLVLTPVDFDLPGEVKSFAGLYKLSADEKTSKVITWANDSTPTSTEQYNSSPIGFTGNTGYYRIAGTEGPRTRENTIPRGVDFRLTYVNIKQSTLGLHIAVNDTRESEKAEPNQFSVDTTLPKDGLHFIKLGAPQKGQQAWLALETPGIVKSGPPPDVTPVKMLPGNKIDFKFTAADGSEVDTAKMRGKVIIVDFWATWCGPCIEALPRLEELYNKYHDRGFEIIGINLDDNRALMDRFLKTHKHPWPQSISAPSGKNPLSDPLELKGIPTFLLIDKTGVYTTIEARKADTDEKIEALLAK